jgi:hypothetical protein
MHRRINDHLHTEPSYYLGNSQKFLLPLLEEKKKNNKNNQLIALSTHTRFHSIYVQIPYPAFLAPLLGHDKKVFLASALPICLLTHNSSCSKSKSTPGNADMDRFFLLSLYPCGAERSFRAGK